MGAVLSRRSRTGPLHLDVLYRPFDRGGAHGSLALKYPPPPDGLYITARGRLPSPLLKAAPPTRYSDR